MHDRRFDTPDFEKTLSGVAFRRFGRGAPLVLMHGGAGSWQHWVRNVDALAQHFEVLAIDQPNYGDSDTLGWDTDLDTYLAHVVTAVDEMTAGAARVHVAGFSFGGYLAAHVAVGLGARTASLSMTGGAGYGKPEGRAFTLGSRRRLHEALGREPTDAELRAMHRENLGKLMVWDRSLIDDWMVDMQKTNVERTRFDSRRVSWADGTPTLIGQLSCPVMVIYGEHDAAAIPPIAERLDRCRAARPDAVTHLIPDCGHWAMYEAPDQVNALMIDFHGAAL